jgi:hypothetical protein
MSGLLRTLQANGDHHRGTLLSVIDETIEPRGSHRIGQKDADDLISRGLAEWVAMPPALQESRLIKLEDLASKFTAAFDDMQHRLDEQARQIAELQRHVDAPI